MILISKQILLIISILQFIVILVLLCGSNNHFHNTSNDNININKITPRNVILNQSNNLFIQKQNNNININNNVSTIFYPGIAVTLMLHSPNWFQRRFTIMVFNILHNLPNGWKIQIFYTGIGQSQNAIDINRGLKRLIDNNIVILTKIPSPLATIKKKQMQMMTEEWFWRNMLSDKVLIFGGNQVICSNSPYTITDFLKFDYIGGPWDYLPKGIKEWKGIGGDGGISIRNRNIMLKVLEYENSKNNDNKKDYYKSFGQEDYFFVSRMVEMKLKGLINITLATREDTLKFSAIGGVANEDVLVASGILPFLSFKDRLNFFNFCPEIKILFPPLHDPNCFGAKPNAEKCQASICALETPARKGGC